MSIARQVNPECQEDDLFWTSSKDNSLHMNDDFLEENVIIAGNREFKEHLIPAYKKLEKFDWYEFENFKSYGFACVTDYLNYYFTREDGRGYTPLEVSKWKRYLKDDWKDYVCECLYLITGKHWYEVTMRGIMQREWVTGYFSGEVKQEDVNYVEMCYFNTGAEFIIEEGEDNYSVYVRDVEDLKEYDVDKVFLFDGYTREVKYKEMDL